MTAQILETLLDTIDVSSKVLEDTLPDARQPELVIHLISTMHNTRVAIAELREMTE
jgi:hypothetical protein